MKIVLLLTCHYFSLLTTLTLIRPVVCSIVTLKTLKEKIMKPFLLTLAFPVSKSSFPLNSGSGGSPLLSSNDF